MSSIGYGTSSHRRDGVETARGNDFRASPLGLLVVLVDEFLYPQRLSREVAAVHPGRDAGRDQLVPVEGVGAHRRQDHLWGVGRRGGG